MGFRSIAWFLVSIYLVPDGGVSNPVMEVGGRGVAQAGRPGCGRHRELRLGKTRPVSEQGAIRNRALGCER